MAVEEHLGALLLHRDPALAEDLARRRLAPLAELGSAARERLLVTLGAWLRRQGSVPAVAEDLHVHRQTVRYRLARLRELLGPSLDDPDARFELELALRATAGGRSRRGAAGHAGGRRGAGGAAAAARKPVALGRPVGGSGGGGQLGGGGVQAARVEPPDGRAMAWMAAIMRCVCAR